VYTIHLKRHFHPGVVYDTVKVYSAGKERVGASNIFLQRIGFLNEIILTFDFCWFCVVIRFFIPATTANDLRLNS